jgi:hypothetical protein
MVEIAASAAAFVVGLESANQGRGDTVANFV